jgi:hypothetical protein
VTKPPKFRDIRRAWINADDDDEVRCYAAMDGRITLADLCEHMAAVAPGVPLDQIDVNFGTLVWVAPATDEERSKRAEWRDQQQLRHEKWERAAYLQLKKKFENTTSEDQAGG